MSITIDFLRQVCKLNPSPWDDQRYMLRSPTYEELILLPDNFEGTMDFVDLGEGWPDQGNWGKCVGWSVSEAMEITDYLLDRQPDDLSAEDCYNKARKYDGLPDFLEGSNNLGAMKGLHKLGICHESCWPTSIDRADPSPGLQCSQEIYEVQSTLHGIDQYYQVPLSVGSFKAALWGLTSDPQWGLGVGVPLVTGFKVYESFKDVGDDGIVPVPQPGETLLGGHSSLLVNWKKIDNRFYFGNAGSWGKGVGDDGVFWIPEEWLPAGVFMDAWVFHNGPPIGPSPSDCALANAYIDLGNFLSRALKRRTRIPQPILSRG